MNDFPRNELPSPTNIEYKGVSAFFQNRLTSTMPTHPDPVHMFIDMDGVLCDTTKKIEELLGVSLESLGGKIPWERIHALCPNMYSELSPTPDMLELWHYVNRYNPKILTAMPFRWSWPNVTSQKRQWVEKFIGPHIEVRFGPHAVDKQYHCRGSSHILVDDSVLNIHQWISRGGVGVLHRTASETIDLLKSHGY